MSSKSKTSKYRYAPHDLASPEQLDWKKWSKEQPKEKLRLTKGVGRAALFGAAVLLLTADMAVQGTKHAFKNDKRTTTAITAEISKAAAPRISARAEKMSQKAEVSAKRRHRIGAKVLQAAGSGLARLGQKTSASVEKQDAAYKGSFAETYRPNSIAGRVSSNYIDSRLQKAKDQRAKKAEAYQEYKRNDREQYLDANPQIELQHKIDSITARANKQARKTAFDLSYLASPNQHLKNLVPTSTENNVIDYDQLASNTLNLAKERTLKNGVMPLFAAQTIQRKLEANETNEALGAVARTESDQLYGASTAVWKLGFMNYDLETGQKVGEVAELTTQEDAGLKMFEIPFDQENPFHKQLMDPASTEQFSHVQLMVGGEGAGIRLVNQSLAQAA